MKKGKNLVFLSPLNDIVFKTLWLRADDDLKIYFNRILSWVLKREFSGFRIGPNETGLKDKDNIANKVDVLLLKDDVKVDIELNNASSSNSIKSVMNKSLVYLTYYITTYYDDDKGNKYNKPIKVEQINFNNFHCPEGYQIERLDYKFTDTTNKISEDGIEYHHIYLPRMEELCYNSAIVNDIYKDFAMLLCKDYESMENLAGSDTGRCALVKMLKALGSDEGMIDAARRREDDLLIAKMDAEEQGLKEGLEQGITEGIEQGIEQAKKEMIISMFENDIPVKKISQCAKMSVEEVEKILEAAKKD